MYNLISQPNTKCSSSIYCSVFADAVNKSPDNYKLVLLAKNIIKIFLRILTQMGETLYIPQMRHLVSVLGTTCKGMILNKVFASANDCKKTFNIRKPTEKMFYNFLDFSSDILTLSGYAGAVRIAKIAKVNGLAMTFIDTKNHLGLVAENDSAKINSFKFKCSVNKYFRVLTLGLVKHPLVNEENPSELKKIALIKVAKDIASLFTSIIAVAGLVTTTVFVSDFAILLISTLSLILALSAKVMQGTTSHKVALLNLK